MTVNEAIAKLQAAINIAASTRCELAKLPAKDALAIVELLKAQEPAKNKASAAEPIKLVRTECIDYVCAACFHKVGLKHKDKDVWYYRDDECTNCGRAVKWDAVDNVSTARGRKNPSLDVNPPRIVPKNDEVCQRK